MIRTKDLQIGDLLRVNRDGLCIKKGTIVEVRAVDADDKLLEKGLIGSAHCRPLDDNQFEGGIWCEYLEPIPLTPDMLLDNGFELQDLGGERISVWTGFGEDSCDEDIEVEFEGIKPIWLKIDGPFYLTTPNIEYLHQLQHFLRDCETGKEIVL